MKKLLVFAFTGLLFIAGSAQAQGPDRFGRPPHPPRMGDDRPPRPGDDRPPPRMGEEKRAKIEMYKIQFITEKLNLTSSEARDFWPVYNEHKTAVDEIVKSKITDEIEFQEAMLIAKKKFRFNLKPILKDEERINEALRVEREFLKTIRFEMMKRRGIN
jgi:hypothetical protein